GGWSAVGAADLYDLEILNAEFREKYGQDCALAVQFLELARYFIEEENGSYYLYVYDGPGIMARVPVSLEHGENPETLTFEDVVYYMDQAPFLESFNRRHEGRAELLFSDARAEQWFFSDIEHRYALTDIADSLDQALSYVPDGGRLLQLRLGTAGDRVVIEIGSSSIEIDEDPGTQDFTDAVIELISDHALIQQFNSSHAGKLSVSMDESFLGEHEPSPVLENLEDVLERFREEKERITGGTVQISLGWTAGGRLEVTVGGETKGTSLDPASDEFEEWIYLRIKELMEQRRFDSGKMSALPVPASLAGAIGAESMLSEIRSGKRQLGLLPLNENEKSLIGRKIDEIEHKSGLGRLGLIDWMKTRRVIGTLRRRLARGDFAVFEAVVESPEDYLLAFGSGRAIGLSRDFLNDETFADYLDEIIFHEGYVSLFGEEDYEAHRRIYLGIQRKIFGEENPLKGILREYINTKYLRGKAGVIVIDGRAGAGKTTVGREIANRLGYRFLDRGMIYRVLGF
ncbi:MAG TPA: (d)CMP kinase, partial [bacterium]|nr:(d)CMP kinase [bacterium]